MCILNARSLYNKSENFKTFIKELGVEIAIVSETWERQELSLDALFNLKSHRIKSYKRPKRKQSRQPGGGCAIVYSENRFVEQKTDIFVPNGVEACWLIIQPKKPNEKIKNIAIASIYVSPSSRFKTATVDHIIDTIHILRAKFDNQINFCIAGDLNRLSVHRILEAYKPLSQIISTATRKSAILENIITDLHTFYQAPECLAPLEVDEDKDGEDSDHNIVMMEPVMFGPNRKPLKKTIVTRPLPESGIAHFSLFMKEHKWEEVILENDIDKKVENFHQTLRSKLDEIFPEKQIKVSYLDKKWMTPKLKQLNRKVKREFYKNRKSPKWLSLKKKFKVLKKQTVQNFYSDFVTELKASNPSKWYSLAKRLGAEQQASAELSVGCLKGFTDEESAELVAEHFSSISQEYSPLNTAKLPAYLPAEKALRVDIEEVAKHIAELKCRKSTQPIDLPSKLRKLFPWELAYPLTDIINSCLEKHHYPKVWKHEWVVPAEKSPNPQSLKDLRKIALTSEFSLIFEGFIKDWILIDILPNIDCAQYGNQKGTGTEHLLVNLMDKILGLLDKNSQSSAVIASLLDWSSAFDRQDSTLAIQKFLKLGVRTKLVPILVSYLMDRSMQVRYNSAYSQTHSLPGGGAQGTLLGVLLFLVQSNDNADCVSSDMRFKFVDDLSILELVLLASLLTEYNVIQHIPNDVGVDESYIPPELLKTQSYLNEIAEWTDKNQMKLNEKKTNYMVFSRSDTEVATRLTLNKMNIDRIEEAKILGVWVTTWLDWEKNTREICRKAYARMSMLTKLKYVGVPILDLVDIYVLYIRSVLEYCSVVWHSTLTEYQSNCIEKVQKVCLKIILGKEYVSYEGALKDCGLQTLVVRREERCLKFALKCLLHPRHASMFPINTENERDTRWREHFKVIKARTSSYRDSTIPYLQRMLNSYVQHQKHKKHTH